MRDTPERLRDVSCGDAIPFTFDKVLIFHLKPVNSAGKWGHYAVAD